MAPKRLGRSKGPLRKAANEMMKAKPGSPVEKVKAVNGTLSSKNDSAKLAKMLEDIFKCYDQDADGQIERVEWLEGEEKRLGKLSFGPKPRRAAVAWFKEAGAEGNVNDGMYLNLEKFKTAYLATSVEESCIPGSEPLKLSDWMAEKAQSLFPRPSLKQNASESLPGAPAAVARAPAYPITCGFQDVLKRFEEARQFDKMVLVLQSGTDNVETYMKYRNYVAIDAKQIIGEMLIRKSKSKEECQAEVGATLRRAICSNGFCKPLWIHMGTSAFDWSSFCGEQFPDEVFSGSRWTIENAFKRGMIDEMQKLVLECGKWQDFHVIITSRFDLEGAETHLRDKIPFYDELAVIVVDPASVE